jgi:hypothetical protein
MLIAAALVTGTAVPALAAWNQMGNAQIPSEHYSTIQVDGFTGPVERIRLHADGRADCDTVRVQYNNGESQQVFSGALYDGQDQTISFPEGARPVNALSLNCRATSDEGSHIAVAADVPAFGRVPQAAYSYGSTAPQHDVTLLASRDFGDLNQRSLMLGDTGAVQAIALQPIGADARCSRIRATFDDGSTSQTIPNGGGALHEGHIYNAHVSSEGRDLNSLDLTCEAANGDQVKINVYAVG